MASSVPSTRSPFLSKFKRGFSYLEVVALLYVAADYWRSHATWLPPSFSSVVQQGLWGSLAILAVCEASVYRHWTTEIRAIPKFLASIVFMVAMLTLEVIMVHFVTAVFGLKWHLSADPLPDTGQWILLGLNEILPPGIVVLLRAPLIELHHYLMLFVLLAFSVLFGYVRAPGMGLGARFCTAMGMGRLLRFITFASTVLPAPRPWCAQNRFYGSPSHPHPWAQKYFVPYSRNTDMIRELLKRDMCFAPETHYPPEYVPSWGHLQFLSTFLRPTDPAIYGNINNDKLFGVVRPGGGCNDLAFSGHMLVAVITACAWQEAYPGWASIIIWFLAFHSGQREIRERHHYSVDVLGAIFVGIVLWRWTRFLWSPIDESKSVVATILAERVDELTKAVKDNDMEKVRVIVEESQKKTGISTNSQLSTKKTLVGIILVLLCVALSVTFFLVLIGG